MAVLQKMTHRTHNQHQNSGSILSRNRKVLSRIHMEAQKALNSQSDSSATSEARYHSISNYVRGTVHKPMNRLCTWSPIPDSFGFMVLEVESGYARAVLLRYIPQPPIHTWFLTKIPTCTLKTAFSTKYLASWMLMYITMKVDPQGVSRNGSQGLMLAHRVALLGGVASWRKWWWGGRLWDLKCSSQAYSNHLSCCLWSSVELPLQLWVYPHAAMLPAKTDGSLEPLNCKPAPVWSQSLHSNKITETIQSLICHKIS